MENENPRNPRDLSKLWYVHRDGFVTDVVGEVHGKCVGVVDAYTKCQAEEEAKERGLL